MIESLENWLASPGRLPHECTITFKKNGNDSAYIDFEPADRMARITLWEDGNCDMEAIGILSGEQIYWQHHTFHSTEELLKEVAAFVVLQCKRTDQC